MKRNLLIWCVLAPVLLGSPATTNEALASVYDSNIVQRMNLAGKQRARAQKIIAHSRSQRALLFRRHGINPKAKPEIFKLQRASSELRTILARERAALILIFTPEQLRQYDSIIAETRSRVMRAAFQ
jgi:hypothetical protein